MLLTSMVWDCSWISILVEQTVFFVNLDRNSRGSSQQARIVEHDKSLLFFTGTASRSIGWFLSPVSSSSRKSRLYSLGGKNFKEKEVM